jgi:hypothetical protein
MNIGYTEFSTVLSPAQLFRSDQDQHTLSCAQKDSNSPEPDREGISGKDAWSTSGLNRQGPFGVKRGMHAGAQGSERGGNSTMYDDARCVSCSRYHVRGTCSTGPRASASLSRDLPVLTRLMQRGWCRCSLPADGGSVDLGKAWVGGRSTSKKDGSHMPWSSVYYYVLVTKQYPGLVLLLAFAVKLWKSAEMQFGSQVHMLSIPKK